MVDSKHAKKEEKNTTFITTLKKRNLHGEYTLYVYIQRKGLSVTTSVFDGSGKRN